jgi:hypothetical protein
MNLRELNDQQRSALLDLLVLSMYSDGNLAGVEDAKIRQVLGPMGVESESEVNRMLDASVTRVRRHATSGEAAREYANSLAQAFSARDQRRLVSDWVGAVLESDHHISAAESDFAAIVREALHL